MQTKTPGDPETRFRQLALALPGAVESSHMGAADFRLNNRIFATLAYVARGQATLKLTPEQQQSFLLDLPDYTEVAPGGWGRMGMTLIRLDAPEEILRCALLTAYNHIQSAQKTKPRSRPAPSQASRPKNSRLPNDTS